MSRRILYGSLFRHYRFGVLPATAILVVVASSGCAANDVQTSPPSNAPSSEVVPTVSPTVGVTPQDLTDCPVSDLRPALEQGIPMEEGVQIGEIQVTHCRNDHALVVLVATTADYVENLPVYMKRTMEGWTIVDYGGHIDCFFKEDLPPETAAACEAIGE